LGYESGIRRRVRPLCWRYGYRPLPSVIENWAKHQKDRPARSEALRSLIEIALSAKPKRQSNRGEK
jgi:hypothetical protein